MSQTGRWIGGALVALALWGTAGCAEGPSGGEPRAETTTPMPEVAEVAEAGSAPAPSASALPVDGCLKGGTTRAEVRALLGEPDSISWGVWLYGRSEITFGYGVVVAFTEVGDNLELC